MQTRERASDRLESDDFKELFQDLVQSIPGAVYRYTLYPDGRDEVEFLTDGCTDIWGVGQEAVSDSPAAIWEMIDPMDVTRMQASVSVSARTLQEWDLRYHITTPSGQRKLLHGRGQPSLKPDGAIVWTALTIDVTAEEVADAEIERSLAFYSELQKHEEFLQTASSVGHDFNNLLTVIIGNAELLEDDALQPSSAQMVREILDAARRSERLVRRLARGATLSGVGLLLVDVNKSILLMTELILRSLPEHVRLDMQLGSEVPRVHVNRGLLDSAILNLTLWARDTMPDGGEMRICTSSQTIAMDQPEIAVNAPLNGRYVVISVRSVGHGLAPEALDQMLQPGNRLKSVNGRQGLSLVDAFARAVGGSVQLDRSREVGTTLNLYLPAHDPDLPAGQ